MRENAIEEENVVHAVRRMLNDQSLTRYEICQRVRDKSFDWGRLSELAMIKKQKLYHWFYDTYCRNNDLNNRLPHHDRDAIYAEVFRQLDCNAAVRIDYASVFSCLRADYNRRIVVSCVSNARARWRAVRAVAQKLNAIDLGNLCFIAFE